MDYSKLKKAELIDRLKELTEERYQVRSSFEFAEKLMEDYGGLVQEHFVLVLLDGRNQIIKTKVLNIGGTNSSPVDLHILVRTLIEEPKTVSFITCHNHPSGQVAPSEADRKTQKKIKEVAKWFDYQYLDDLIVSRVRYYSACESKHFV